MRDAVEVLSGLGCGLYHGRALDVLGRLQSRLDPAGAGETLAEAARVFGDCGAPWRRDRAFEAGQALGSVAG